MNFLEKLNNIDIKDIKPEDIKQKLKDRLDISINIVLVVISLVSFIYLMTKDQKQKSALQAELTILNERMELLQEKKTVDAKKKKFLESFPQILPKEQLTSKISEFATDYDIDIISFTTERENNDAYKTITNIIIKIASNNFKNIILFIKALERSPFSIRVNRWEGRSSSEFINRRKRTENEENIITVDIEIAATKLKISGNRPPETEQ